MSQEEILTQARNIKEYCINHTTNEEQCPFFNGYKTEGMLQIVICELNNRIKQDILPEDLMKKLTRIMVYQVGQKENKKYKKILRKACR